ncbi:DUF1995 family protein [Synechococcus elongatus]
MLAFPADLETAVEQAKDAAQQALAAGLTRIQVDLAIPELKIQPIAWQFLQAFVDREAKLRVFFPDPGAAALARRDWGELPFAVRGMEELKAAVQPEEELFIFIEPSSVEVQRLEQLCQEIGDRPVILLNARLEDVATIGIGYAARQLRERFLNQWQSAYYLSPLEGAAIFQSYPQPWQVWQETETGYELLQEYEQRPNGEDLDRLFAGLAAVDVDAPIGVAAPTATASRPNRGGLLNELQRFLRALGS